MHDARQSHAKDVQNNQSKGDGRQRAVYIPDDPRSALSAPATFTSRVALMVIGMRLGNAKETCAHERSLTYIAIRDNACANGCGKAQQECGDHVGRSRAMPDVAPSTAAKQVGKVLQSCCRTISEVSKAGVTRANQSPDHPDRHQYADVISGPNANLIGAAGLVLCTEVGSGE